MKMKWCLGLLAALVIAGCASGGKAGGGVSGTATAAAQGFHGEVTVTVTLEKGKITNVTAEGPEETAGIGSRALTILPAQMVKKNSVEVDVVGGASLTSQGVIEAARQAIAKING